MSEIKVNSIVDASGGNTATINGVAPNVNNIRGKNKIINGAMQVAQRGTSGQLISNGTSLNGYLSLDRWKLLLGSTDEADVTLSQDTSAPANTGLNYSLKTTVDVAETALATDERMGISYYIEGYDAATFTGIDATISFWVRSSITGTYSLYCYSESVNEIFSTTYTINAANTWEYKTINIPTSGTSFTANNSRGIELGWVLSAGSGFQGNDASTAFEAYTTTNLANGHGVDHASTVGATFYLTGVQLEAGDTASGFEHLSYGETLAMCQRYYQLNPSGTGVWAAGTVNVAGGISLPVAMRIVPSVGIINGTDAIDHVWSGRKTLSSFNLYDTDASVPYTGSGWSGITTVSVAGPDVAVIMQGHLYFDAEL